MDSSKSLTKVAIIGSKFEIENGQDRSAYYVLNSLLPALKLKGYDAELIDWRTKDYAFEEAKFCIVGPVWAYANHLEEFKDFIDKLEAQGV